MSDTAQSRALRSYRERLTQRGMARFEVLGLEQDRELIRSLARRLAGDNQEVGQLRALIHSRITGDPPSRGVILAALRRSPLAGAELNLERPVIAGREVDL